MTPPNNDVDYNSRVTRYLNILSPIPRRAMAPMSVAAVAARTDTESESKVRRNFFAPTSRFETPSPSLDSSRGYSPFSTDSDCDATTSTNEDPDTLEGSGDADGDCLEAYGDISLNNAYFVPSAPSDISPRRRIHARQPPTTPSFYSSDLLRRSLGRSSAYSRRADKPLRLKQKPRPKKSVRKVGLNAAYDEPLPPPSDSDDFQALVQSIRFRVKANARRGAGNVPLDFSKTRHFRDIDTDTDTEHLSNPDTEDFSGVNILDFSKLNLGTSSSSSSSLIGHNQDSDHIDECREYNSIDEIRKELERAAADLHISKPPTNILNEGEDDESQPSATHAPDLKTKNYLNSPLARFGFKFEKSPIPRSSSPPRSSQTKQKQTPEAFCSIPDKYAPAGRESPPPIRSIGSAIIPGPVFVKPGPPVGSAKLPKRPALPVWDVFAEAPRGV